ncbi:MAG: peptidase S1, partial [Terriglobia bacterium]
MKHRYWVGLLLLVLAAAAGYWLGSRTPSRTPIPLNAPIEEPAPPAPDEPLPPVTSANADPALPASEPSSNEQVTIGVYRAVSPAVVNVTTRTQEWNFFFGVVPSKGSGSGFIIDREGHILTNNHVIA